MVLKKGRASQRHISSQTKFCISTKMSQWQLTGVPVMAHLASGLGGMGLGSETKPPGWEVLQCYNPKEFFITMGSAWTLK